ncbi:MAG: hydantoinase B/oxoprolinase family protein [Granulosicoccus sp.]
MGSTSHGDTFNCPVETAEARYGFNVLEKRLDDVPQHSGVHPGGAGIALRYQMRESATLSVGYSHAIIPVWSQKGCVSGGINWLTIVQRDGQRKTYSFTSGFSLDVGDIVEIVTAYGGSTIDKPDTSAM